MVEVWFKLRSVWFWNLTFFHLTVLPFMWCGVHSASECDGLSQGVRWMLFFWLVSVVRNKEEGMIYSDRVRVRIHPDSMLLSLVGSICGRTSPSIHFLLWVPLTISEREWTSRLKHRKRSQNAKFYRYYSRNMYSRYFYSKLNIVRFYLEAPTLANAKSWHPTWTRIPLCYYIK